MEHTLNARVVFDAVVIVEMKLIVEGVPIDEERAQDDERKIECRAPAIAGGGRLRFFAHAEASGSRAAWTALPGV